MEKQLIEIFECDCKPSFVWKTKNTFRNHFKSKRHQNYVSNIQETDHRKTIVDLQNKISQLKIENGIWKNKCIELKNKYEPDINLI